MELPSPGVILGCNKCLVMCRPGGWAQGRLSVCEAVGQCMWWGDAWPS